MLEHTFNGYPILCPPTVDPESLPIGSISVPPPRGEANHSPSHFLGTRTIDFLIFSSFSVSHSRLSTVSFILLLSLIYRNLRSLSQHRALRTISKVRNLRSAVPPRKIPANYINNTIRGRRRLRTTYVSIVHGMQKM